jgi:hypothetical protein
MIMLLMTAAQDVSMHTVHISSLVVVVLLLLLLLLLLLACFSANLWR